MSTIRLADVARVQANPSAGDAAEFGIKTAAIGKRIGATAWRIFRPIVRVALKAMVEHKVRRAARELARLDDRTLRDIGLSRCGIDDAVRANRVQDLIPFGLDWDLLNGNDRSRGAHRRRG